MCVQLTRIYKCTNLDGSMVNHVRKWLVQCSTPPVVGRPQPCLEALDLVDEQYEWPCDNCRGTSCVELEKSFYTNTRYFGDKARYCPGPGGKIATAYAKSVKNYHDAMATLLVIRRCMVEWDNFAYFRSTPLLNSKLECVLEYVIPELTYRADPSHGYVRNPFGNGDGTAGRCCPCPKLE